MTDLHLENALISIILGRLHLLLKEKGSTVHIGQIQVQMVL